MAEYTLKNGRIMTIEEAAKTPHTGSPKRIAQLGIGATPSTVAELKEKSSKQKAGKSDV